MAKVVLQGPHLGEVLQTQLNIDAATLTILETEANGDLEAYLVENGVLRRKSMLKLKMMLQGTLPSTDSELKALFDTKALNSLLSENAFRKLSYPECGSSLGRYELLKVIGEGGQSRVYLARHPFLRRQVALKILSPTLSARSKSAREDFINEANRYAEISHRSFPQVYDFHETDDHVYISMEYLEGQTIQHLLEHLGAFSVHHTLIVAGQMCRALEFLHDRGIIHRDLKPENVMLTPDSSIRLIDLGVALQKEGGKAAQKIDEIYGSPYYMAPEQIKGYLDYRSDIYSFGVALYAMVTGQLPFLGEDLAEVIRQHDEVIPVAPMALNREVPESLSDLILEMLAKKPEDRPQDFAVLLERLGMILARQILPGSRTPVAAMREFLGV